MKKIASGNEALAYGALRAGVKVVAGYPGTPSSEVIASLLEMDLPGTRVEWSVNEKVAFEVAAGAAMAGHRALCTMKMSGLNVCYDSLIGVAYSGCAGGFVVYVADDPGVSAGMCEQDTRVFAAMADMPMLEPCSLQEVYDMTATAFDMAEKIGGPVFLRLVTNNSQSHGVIEIEDRVLPKDSAPMPPYDPAKYTKAGALICMQQHRDLIERLEAAEKYIAHKELDKLELKKKDGLGVVSVGITNGYLREALNRLKDAGTDVSEISTLRLAATIPYAKNKIVSLLSHCSKVIIAEELEPLTERYCFMEAYKNKLNVQLYGKEDGTFSRVGQFDAFLMENGIREALGLPKVDIAAKEPPERLCAARPIGFCAGCPHRGAYMGLERGLKAIGLKKNEAFITGDIGCTILGSCPPFDILWTELSMGASIPFAHGVAYSNIPAPVIATIGDSTFFHAGIPGLVNALQHNINMLVIILDNGWTAMTGMQVNPGTSQASQKKDWKQLDIESVVRGVGVKNLWTVDAYDVKAVADAVEAALKTTGLKVILSRRECAIQAARRKVKRAPVTFTPASCVGCKRCIDVTGCPAIELKGKVIAIDTMQCNNCGLCAGVCPTKALRKAE
ncbi:MAG: indolepyruvate ferredoxin oxidoreductase subunit alpha [Synergistaceae bacterium]|nr:indolepyruvate ferredoxin oxidoreductase subunit alpha [Synergistaceae bacterium]